MTGTQELISALAHWNDTVKQEQAALAAYDRNPRNAGPQVRGWAVMRLRRAVIAADLAVAELDRRGVPPDRMAGA